MPAPPERHIVTLGEGRSPLVDVDLAGRRAFIKQCGQQPTGSFKDLGMTVLVSAAQAIAKKREVRALVCASTGDTTAALAAYGARAKIPVVVLLPRGQVSKAQLVQPLSNGAKVLELDGDFDACMRVVAEIGKRPGFFLANSKNPLRLLGQMTVALEIVRDLDWRAPDVVVVPSGNLGNVYALWLGFALLRSLHVITSIPRLVAAQVAAADPLHRARLADPALAHLTPVVAGDTIATAIRIGDPVSFARARIALTHSRGTTTSSSEDDVVTAMRVLDRQGLLACPHTGTAVDGARQVIASGFVKKRDVLVVVSTASGLKFIDSKARAEMNEPTRVPADVDAVARALA
jgi:threonine synthase